MSDVPGWMAEAELDALRELATGKTILEIGTYKGRSAIAMAEVAKAVWCLDTFCGDTACGFGWFLPDFYQAVFSHEVRDKIRVIVASWQETLPMLSLVPFDVLFYDADHSFQATHAAGLIMDAGARRESPLVFHDFNDGHPDVMHAVNEVADASGRKLRRMVGALAVLD